MTKAMRPNYGAKCKVPLGWRVTPVSLIFPSFPLQQDLHLRCTHNPSADNKTALQPPGRGSTLAKAAVRDPELCAQGGKRHGKLPAHAASRQLQVCAAPLQPALGAAARHRHKPPPRGKSTPTEEILGPPGGGGGEGEVAVSSSAARPYLSRGPARCPSSAGRRWSRSPGWTPRPRSGPATRRRGRAPARARGSALPPRPPSASPPPPAAAAGAAAPPARPSRHRHRPAGGGLRGGTRPEIGEENGEKRGCDGSTMTSWQLPPPV